MKISLHLRKIQVIIKKDTIYQRILEVTDSPKAVKLSKMLNVSEQTISQYKNKASFPSIETVARASELSGASIHWLLTGEGEKFVDGNVINPTNLLVSSTRGVDTSPAQSTTIHSGSQQATQLHATINSITQQMHPSKEAVSVLIPSVLLSPDLVLFKIEGDGWADEGLRDGDLLLAKPVSGNVAAGPVIARVNGHSIVRRYDASGSDVLLSALEGNHPVYRLPGSSVVVEFEVFSFIHNYSH